MCLDCQHKPSITAAGRATVCGHMTNRASHKYCTGCADQLDVCKSCGKSLSEHDDSGEERQ